MPETIIGLTEDTELRRVLLRDAGYLTIPVSSAEQASNISGYLARRDAIRRADRATADAFYRSIRASALSKAPSRRDVGWFHPSDSEHHP
jgi:hypothetical protein